MTLGVLHSGNCAYKTSASLHWEIRCKRWRSSLGVRVRVAVGLPSQHIISSILPSWGQPSPGEEMTGQGKQCHYNTAPLRYPSILWGIINPVLFLVPQPCTCLGFSDLLHSTAHRAPVSPGQQHRGIVLSQSDGLCPWQSVPGLGTCG